MAVLQMRRISVCALKKNRKSILEALQRSGVVELTDLEAQDGTFEKTDMSAAQSTFEKNAQLAAQALEVLAAYANVKGFSPLGGRTPLTREQYDAMAESCAEYVKTASRLTALSKLIAEKQGEILKLQTQLDALVPWLGLDVSMRFSGTKSTSAFIGSFDGQLDEQQLSEKLALAAPELDAVYAQIISAGSDLTCVMIICLKRDAEKLDDALRSCGFVRPAAPSKQSPDERRKILEQQAALAQNEIDQAKAEIASCAHAQEQLRFMADYFTMRAEKYGMINRLAQTKNTFLLSGYVPEKYARAVESELTQKYEAAVSLEQPGEREQAPVLLQNNPFSAPVETVLESYSLPSKREIDPTTIMSVFYYVLFGMMLSDAGYGIIMTIGCAVALMKLKGLEGTMKKMVNMFFWCGLSTTFWGFMFGGFFGDAVAVISSTFFGSSVTLEPLWFNPVDDPIRLLVFSFLMGIIHLFTGLAIQFYQYVREKKIMDAIYDVVFWYLFVGGGIVYLLTMDMITSMMGLSFTLSAGVGTVAAVCALIGAAGVVFTGGRESKNPVKRMLKGLYSAYNVTGYLSDILSYSRLLALGLATGVIAQVFNKMGSMAGGGVVGAIVFILVFIVGHALNLGINLLGAYVHTNRLQFVEFFGKFYEGGGHAFTPFSAHTKYYKFKEEM